MEEKILLRQIAQGNTLALKTLYETYKARVFTTALSYLQNYHDAEELTQDVFVAIHNSASRFQEQSQPGTWIYSITVNKCLDKLRADKAKKRFSFFKAQSIEEIQEPASFDHPGVQLERKELSAYLFKALNTLPEHQKTAFILSKIEGLGNIEIGEIMDKSVGAVESLLSRAKDSLKKELSSIYKNKQ